MTPQEIEMLDALKGVTRILQAFSATTTLGATQMARLAKALAVIKKAEGK